MKKVLITGATGFIGKHVLNPLLENGFEIYPVKNIDLLNANNIKKLFQEQKPNYLLHLAWETTPSKYWNSELNFEWVQASIEILKQFYKNGGGRAVFAGTCAEETSKTPYGTCKKALKEIAESYCSLNNISFAWGRIFFLYGSNENPKRLVPYVINNLLNNQEALCSDGQQIRDFLHVQDVANAFAEILNSDVNNIVEISSGESVKIADIINKIGEITGKQELIKLGYKKSSDTEPKIILGDNSKLKEIGWTPKYTIDQGLKETIDWWKNVAN